MARARHDRLAHVRTGRARRLHLRSNVPVPLQLDGDPWGFTPAEVDVLSSALSVATT